MQRLIQKQNTAVIKLNIRRMLGKAVGARRPEFLKDQKDDQKKPKEMPSPEGKWKPGAQLSDIGIGLESKPSEDSFEKYFSKELDLEEGIYASI